MGMEKIESDQRDLIKLLMLRVDSVRRGHAKLPTIGA